MTDRELMQMALDALEAHADIGIKATKQIETLRARLAQPEQEPVAWELNEVILDSIRDSSEVVAPPQRGWQGLTIEEIEALRHIIDWTADWSYGNFARAIEAKLKEKNHDKP